MRNFSLTWINALISKWHPTDHLWQRLKWATVRKATKRGKTYITPGSLYTKEVEAMARLATCLSTNPFKEERTSTSWENVKGKEDTEGRLWHYICIVRNYIPTAEKATAGCSAGSVASGHTVRESRVGVEGLYVRDLRQRLSGNAYCYEGPTLASTICKIMNDTWHIICIKIE